MIGSTHPLVISGGMGVRVSSEELARVVSTHPSGICMGFISGTAAEVVVARELQLGDPGGVWRRQFEALEPLLRDSMRQELWRRYERYYIPGGKRPDKLFKRVPPPRIDSPSDRTLLTLAANFAIVRRAKMDHSRPVGINYLRKIELQLLPGLFGAMLAGVDYIAVGAGDPSDLPGLIDRLSLLQPVQLPLKVRRAKSGQNFVLELDPWQFVGPCVVVKRPLFLAIISSHLQAAGLYGNPATRPDGFVVENDSAGGHNAPPVGLPRFGGGPIEWGPRDEADVEAIARLGLPFWLAGGYGSAEGLQEALRPRGEHGLHATGIQVGTPFALCRESGMEGRERLAILAQIWRRQLRVESTRLSPTGFPLKAVTSVPGTVADPEVKAGRMPACDLGYLATPTWNEATGQVDYICPAEPASAYARKGGSSPLAAEVVCVCNGLMATAGLGGVRPDGRREPPLITLGRNVGPVREIQMANRSIEYDASDVIEQILRGLT